MIFLFIINIYIIITIIMRINISFNIIIKNARYNVAIFSERFEIWIWIIIRFSFFKFIEVFKWILIIKFVFYAIAIQDIFLYNNYN